MVETTPLGIPSKSSEDAHVQALRVLFRSALIGATLLATSASHAALDAGQAKALLPQNACLSCHAIESRMVGPAYRDVATKYKGGNPVVFGVRIKSGGVGKRSEIAMLPRAQLSDTDTRILATWILADCPGQ